MLDELSHLLARFRPYLLLAPPRSSSTALARALMANSKVTSYIHEPCDLYAHANAPLSSIIERLTSSDLAHGTLIKEMTFQLGEGRTCTAFLKSVSHPVIILLRDPQVSIASRMRMVLQDLAAGDELNETERSRAIDAVSNRDFSGLDSILTEERFPITFTGWHALAHQIVRCRREGIEYVLVESRVLRAEPERTIKALCRRIDLPYEPAMLDWETKAPTALGALAEQSHWYQRVLASTGFERDTGERFPIDRFPGRFHPHLEIAIDIYRATLVDPNMISQRTTSNE